MFQMFSYLSLAKGHSYFMEPCVKSMCRHISNPGEFGGIHIAVFLLYSRHPNIM